MNRRSFLRGSLIMGAVTVAHSRLSPLISAVASPAHLNGEIGSLLSSQATTTARRFAPVKVARDRVTRTIVGLRPYRPAGFVVSREQIGNKLLVHNYGHGGAGVTLSWGTSTQALNLAEDFIISQTNEGNVRRSRTPRRFAVLGCGVIGLSTALLLQRRYQNGPGTVTIYARDLPPETTSNIAGAFWYPTSVFDTQTIDPAFNDRFRYACQISNRAFQNLIGAEYGVHWIESYELLRNEASLERELFGGTHLYPAVTVHRDPQHYFGSPIVRQFTSMMIEPHTYLRALLRDFYVAGGRLVVREFRNRSEIARLPEPVIFNCTGLGARDLFNDQSLIPVRGQLEILLPQPEIDYCYIGGLGYMFPRRDGIVLGGTFDHDDWSLDPDPEQTKQILEGHTTIMNSRFRDG